MFMLTWELLPSNRCQGGRRVWRPFPGSRPIHQGSSCISSHNSYQTLY